MPERRDRELGRMAGAAQFAAAAVVAWALRPAADALAQRLIADDRLHSPRARAAIATRDAQIATLQGEKEKAERESAAREARLAEVNDELAGLREELRASEQKRGEAQRLAERIPNLEQMLGQKGNELGVANEQIAKLERDLKREREDKESAEAQVKSLEQELHAERVKSSTFRAAIADGGAARSEADEDAIAAPAEFTFRGVAELAREALDRLEIPDGALSHLQDLDRATNAAVRAEDTWRALRALHEYAGEAEHIKGGFYEWCQYSHSPHVLPTNKVAMKESDTVQSSAPLRDKRRFEVAREVDPTGRILMLAHLKPVEGGGEDIPRIYFHDDTGGRTKKIHIGAIAPHSRFPNTKS